MRKIGAILFSIFRLPAWLAFGLAGVSGGLGFWQLTAGGIANLPFVPDIAARIGVDLALPALAAAALFGLCLKIAGGLAIFGLLSATFGRSIAATPVVAAFRAATLDDETATPSYIVENRNRVKRTYAFHDNLQRRMGQSLGPAVTGRKRDGFGAALRTLLVLGCLGAFGLVGASFLLGTPATDTATVDSAGVADLTVPPALTATISDTIDWALPLGRAWFDATLADALGGDMIARAKIGALALGGFLALMQLKKLLFGRKRRRPKTLQEQFA